MRRFNYVNRSTLFTPALLANISAKRGMRVPSAKEFDTLIHLVLSSGLIATATGLIFCASKMSPDVETLFESKDDPGLRAGQLYPFKEYEAWTNYSISVHGEVVPPGDPRWAAWERARKEAVTHRGRAGYDP